MISVWLIVFLMLYVVVLVVGIFLVGCCLV